MSRRSQALPGASQALTYAEVAATQQGDLPPGYHHVRRTATVGHGPKDFDRASQLLMTWELQRRAGLRVISSSPRVAVGDVARMGLGLGPLRISAPCRVVTVVAEPTKAGFAYGTLAGHPEEGEESFMLSLLEDGNVQIAVVAFTRPATWWSRAGGPIKRLVQRWVTNRYLTALRRPS